MITSQLVAIQANDPISSFHISGGFLLTHGRQKTVVIVVIYLSFLMELSPSFSFSLKILYCWLEDRLLSIARPKYFVLRTLLISSLSILSYQYQIFYLVACHHL